MWVEVDPPVNEDERERQKILMWCATAEAHLLEMPPSPDRDRVLARWTRLRDRLTPKLVKADDDILTQEVQEELLARIDELEHKVMADAAAGDPRATEILARVQVYRMEVELHRAPEERPDDEEPRPG